MYIRFFNNKINDMAFMRILIQDKIILNIFHEFTSRYMKYYCLFSFKIDNIYKKVII